MASGKWQRRNEEHAAAAATRAGNLNMQDDAPLGANCAAPRPQLPQEAKPPKEQPSQSSVWQLWQAGRRRTYINQPATLATSSTCGTSPKEIDFMQPPEGSHTHAHTHIYLYIRIYNCLYSTAYAKPTPTRSQLLPRCRPDRSDINKRRNDKSNP